MHRPHNVYEFGRCRLDVTGRAVTCDGRPVPLAPKAFDLLLLLVENPGRAFSKQELLTALWADTFVEEANLSFQISVLRKALGEDGARWIETVPKHGYRFNADVQTILAAAHAPAAVPATTKRRVWLAAVVAAVMMAASYVVFRSAPPAMIGARATIAVPLTSYEGVQDTPSLSPDGSQIAFVWNGAAQDNYDIWVKLVGPGEPLQLTTNPLPDHGPAWSPDGRRIAFQRRTGPTGVDIILIPALGGAERKVASLDIKTGDVSSPHALALSANLSWTPDGKWIAFGGARSPDEPRGVWLVAVDHPETRRLTEAGALAPGDWLPAISRDGRSLAFVRQVTRALSAVHVLPLTSTYTPAGAAIRVTPETTDIRGVAWTPDDRSLVFSLGPHNTLRTRLYRVRVPSRASDGNGEPELLSFGEQASSVSISRNGRLVFARPFRDANIWKIALTEGADRLNPARVVPSTFDELTPDYSPDGKRLAFTSTRSGAEEIWIANADGSNPSQLTTMGGPLCANPRWSPDGSRILFHSRRDGSNDLYVIRPDTAELRKITDDPAEEAEARWSRDGRTIYFSSNRTGRLEVWKMPADGGIAVRITRNGGVAPAESGDGRFLYYARSEAPATSIWRVPVDGGEEQPIVEELTYSLNFVVADPGLYFLSVGSAPLTTAIEFYDDVRKTRTTLLRVGKRHSVGMALSPDKRWLLYSVVDSSGTNLMLVDNFR